MIDVPFLHTILLESHQSKDKFGSHGAPFCVDADMANPETKRNLVA